MNNKDRVWLSSPHMGGQEMAYVNLAFDTNWISPLGPNVNAFEEKLASYCEMGHCAVLSSGTAAIHLALRILGIKEKDEVIVQTFTFCGSINPVLYEKASPILVDSEVETWNLDPELLKEAIEDRIKNTGKKPKAVIAVHLYGMPAKIEEIKSVCESYGIPLIEDAAEALGSTYKGKKIGAFGDFSILSFNGNKIITTSGGGALLSNNQEWIEKSRFLATQAREKAIHYEHKELGFNYRMSNVLAGIGLGQMDALPMHIEKRRANHAFYVDLFKGSDIEVHKEMSESLVSNHWLTAILFPIGDENLHLELMKALADENIESRPLWKPMHQQPLYKDCLFYENGVSDDLFSRGLCMPSGSNMTDEHKERIGNVVKHFLGK